MEEGDGGETDGTGGHGRSPDLKPVVMDGLHDPCRPGSRWVPQR